MNNTTRTALVLFTGLALTTAVSAQGSPPFSGLLPQATFPSDHAPDLVNKKLTDGAGSVSWAPFSYGKSRFMFLYESHDLKIPNGKNITHLGFQAEGTIKSVGHRILLSVAMGKSQSTAKTASTTFASNYDGSPTDVFGGTAGAILALPDLGDSINPNPDRPFVFVPLSTPYRYDSSRNVLADYKVLANSNSSSSWTYYLDVARFVSPVVKMGLGCKDSGNNIPELESRPTEIGASWYIDLRKAPASSLATFVFSLGKAAVPFPFLRPDCNAYIDFSAPNFVPFLFFGNTTSYGTHTWSFPVPNDPMLNDVHLYSQATIADIFAPGGLVLTNGDDMQIGMDPQMTMIYAQGDPATLTTGSPYANFGVISHFKTN